MGRRFVESQHPRDGEGKFRKKAGPSASAVRKARRAPSRKTRIKAAVRRQTTGTGLVNNFTRAKAAYEVYNDVGDAVSNTSKAVAYGATGNYVKSGLHGTKAATATYRLGSRGARALIVNSKSTSGNRKQLAQQKLNKLDDRVQSVENIATIGLLLTGSPPARRAPKRSTPGQADFFTETFRRNNAARKGNGLGATKVAKARRTRNGPVYVITDVQKVRGARVRR